MIEELEILASNNKLFSNQETSANDLEEAKELFGELYQKYKDKIYEASKILKQTNIFLQAKGSTAYFTQEARNKICFLYAQKNEEEGIQFLQEIYAPLKEKNKEQYKSILIKLQSR